MNTRYFILLSLASLLLFAACSPPEEEPWDNDDDQAPADDDTNADDDNDDSTPLEIAWGTCPDYIQVDPAMTTECATVQLPLWYDEKAGATIPIFLYRVLGAAEQKKGQLWLLQGGPGGSGADYATILATYTKAFPDWDFYSLDHRGVGNSEKLDCPQYFSAPFDYEGCAASLRAQWGDDLQAFSTTNAARDLGVLIEATKPEALPVYVYGASYGTYWLQRYLQLYPAQAQGAVADSICSPGYTKLDEYDLHFNQIGRKIMDRCGEDATCADKLGTIDADPWTALGKVYEKIDAGEICAPLQEINREFLRLGLGALEADYFLRILIPSAVYRLNRCQPKDVLAIGNLLAALGIGKKIIEDPNLLESSMTLGTIIILSELYGDGTYAEALEFSNSAYFSEDLGPFMGEIYDWGQWPTYPDYGFFNDSATTDMPLLMMNGDYDPQTTLDMATPMGDNFQGTAQTFVTVPWSPHGVVFSAQTPASIDGFIQDDIDAYLLENCGGKMLMSFLGDPAAPPDTSCLSSLYPLEFSADSELNQFMSSMFYGADDMWEGTPTKEIKGRAQLFKNPIGGSRLLLK